MSTSLARIVDDTDAREWCICGHIKSRHDERGCKRWRSIGEICGCEVFMPREDVDIATMADCVSDGLITSPEALSEKMGISKSEARRRFVQMQSMADDEVAARRVQYQMTFIPEMTKIVCNPDAKIHTRLRVEKVLAQRLGYAGKGGVSVNIQNNNQQQTNVVPGSFDEWIRKISEDKQ